MKKIIHYFGLCILSIFVLSCQNDFTEQTETETNTHQPAILVNTSFNGFVHDESGEVLENVSIILNESIAFTDSRGFFQISGKVDASGAFLKAKLDGYYEAYGNVVPSADNEGHVRFTLKLKKAQDIVASNADSRVVLENGSEVSFKANSFVDETGNAYQGSVVVYATYIDPSAPNFRSVMPGDLTAVTALDDEVILQSFGMLNVELESESGAPLQISKNAEIKVKVPNTRADMAQDIIPLWYFDTSDGLWKEEGSALLTDGYYIGEVAHFTLWNCDIPFPYVTLCGNLYSRGPVQFSEVKVTWVETGEMAVTYTDDMGNFCGKVPYNALLLIEIIDECGTVVYSQEVGPLTEDAFVDIVLSPEEYDYFYVSGTLTCDGELVTDGYVFIELDNSTEIYHTIVDSEGNFSAVILNCDSENITITGYDISNNQYGDAHMFPIEDVITIESLSACEYELEYKIVFTFDGQEHVVPNPEFYINFLGHSIIDSYDTVDNFTSNVTYSVYKDESIGNGLVHSYTIPGSLPDNHIIYYGTLPSNLQGVPGSIIFMETSEYVEYYLPIAQIFIYSSSSPNFELHEGSMLMRAEK